MKRFSNVDTSVLKHHYEKKVQDLEQEKRILQVSFFLCIISDLIASHYTYIVL